MPSGPFEVSRTTLPQRKAFPLRLDPRLYSALKKWSDDELRSVNGQIEYLLRRALKEAGRWPPDTET